MTKTATPTAHRPLLDLARDAVPGVAEVAAALPAVDAALTAARARPGRSEVAPVEDAADAVLAGKPVPADLGAHVREAQEDNRTATAHVEALIRLRGQLLYRRRDALAQHVDAGLAVLADQLEHLLSEARPVAAKLDGVRDADAAIAAGTVAEWTRFRALADRHTELREAQATLLTDTLHPPDTPRASTVATRDVRALVAAHGTVADAAELYPDGLPEVVPQEDTIAANVRIVNGRVVTTATTTRPEAAPPWLGSPVDALAYLATPDARPWVPSLADLLAARDAAAEAKRKQRQQEAGSLIVTPTRQRQITRDFGEADARGTHHVVPGVVGSEI